MHINHITLNTGHLARSERAEVNDATLDVLVPWLAEAESTGAHVPLPVAALSHYSAQVIMQSGALIVTIYGPAGPHNVGSPHVGDPLPLITMGVAQRSRQGAPLWSQLVDAFGARSGLQKPAEPWCAVAIHPGIGAYSDTAHWIGDLERCIAWAWITRNPDLRPAT